MKLDMAKCGFWHFFIQLCKYFYSSILFKFICFFNRNRRYWLEHQSSFITTDIIFTPIFRGIKKLSSLLLKSIYQPYISFGKEQFGGGEKF
jgi:hypothetical protein